jgi:hypothetical protein
LLIAARRGRTIVDTTSPGTLVLWIDAPSHRRLWASLGAVVAAAVVWMAWQPSAAPPALRQPPVTRPSTHRATPAAVRIPAQVQPSPVLRVDVPLSVEPGAEICGFGTVALADDDPFGVRSLPPALRRAAERDADRLMLDSGEEQLRAAGLLIAARSREAQAREHIDRLAQLAATSRDPLVYAIAIEGCRFGDSGTCQLLNPAQWARLDADNALPWLALAAQAREAQQPQVEGDAIFHAALAPRSDAHAGLLPRLVERAFAGREPSLARTLALASSWSVQAAWALPPADEALRYCVEAPAEAQRSCDALAQTLAARGSTVLELTVGIAIGRHLHWREDRLQALEQERDALGEASRLQGAALDLSCETVRHQQAWMQRLARGGEMQAARELIAASGYPLELWSGQFRRNLELAAATAAEAASAPP